MLSLAIGRIVTPALEYSMAQESFNYQSNYPQTYIMIYICGWWLCMYVDSDSLAIERANYPHTCIIKYVCLLLHTLCCTYGGHRVTINKSAIAFAKISSSIYVTQKFHINVPYVAQIHSTFLVGNS